MSQKIFCLLIDFRYLDHFLHGQEYLMKKISENYEKFYIINTENLKSKSTSIYLDWDKFSDSKFNKTKVEELIHNNFTLLNPSSLKELDPYFKDNEVLIITQLQRTFVYYKLWLYLNKKNIHLIIISNSSNQDSGGKQGAKSNISKLKLYIAKNLPRKIFTFFTIFNLFPKIDIRFDSNKNFYNFFEKKKKSKNTLRPLYKEVIQINSRAFDLNKLNKLKISEDYIVFIEADLNHKEDVAIRGVLNEKIIENHYKILNRHLKHLSKIFNKEVIVCIHPKYNLDLIKSKYKDFKVVQHQTKEFIYQSFLVIFFESSAIIDAFYLKKNIIQIKPSSIWTVGIDYVKNFGITQLDIQKKENENIEKFKLEQMMLEGKKGYDAFIEKYIKHSNDDELGADKVIRIIKQKYF